MPVLPQASVMPSVGMSLHFRNRRKLEQSNQHGKCEQGQPDHHIRHFHGGSLLHTEGMQSLRGHLGEHVLVFGHSTQYEQAAEVGPYRRTQRIKGLRQIQAAGSRLRRSKYGYIGIRRNLQRGDARGQDHQRRKKQWIGHRARRRHEQERPKRHSH